MNKSKNIGTACESALVKYLEKRGYMAQRVVLHGALDEGDVEWGTDKFEFLFEVKGGHAAERASDAQIMAWIKETETERWNAGTPGGAWLVTKRKGYGLARPGSWWAHWRLHGIPVRTTLDWLMTALEEDGPLWL